MIRIVGLGPGSAEDLTIKSINIMKNANNLYLRTEKHPNVDYIRQVGIKFKTFDSYYDNAADFDEVYDSIARRIVEIGDVVYAVPGHPLVAEKSVQLIIQYAREKNIDVEIIPAISFIDAVINSMHLDPVEGLKIIDGLQIDTQRPDTSVANLVTQVYSRLIASDIKLKLMDSYDDEQEVYMIRAAGIPQLEKIEKMPLYEIDRVNWVDYLTTLYIPKANGNKGYSFTDLIGVMDRLRGENGCPWDKEQNHESLKRYLIEESYEVIDAIDNKDIDGICEELGDVLLQVVFHSTIAKELGEFDINDVINGITDKMIKRHTHVFGEDKCSTPEEVIVNWEKIKREEKSIESYTENLRKVPKSFPALIRSYKVQEKAADVGFDWDNIETPINKVKEELNELLEVYKTQKYGKIIEELGDLLFSIVNVARFLNINPEFALNKTIEKFINRFEYIEHESAKIGRTMDDMTLMEMDNLWDKAKIKGN